MTADAAVAVPSPIGDVLVEGSDAAVVRVWLPGTAPGLQAQRTLSEDPPLGRRGRSPGREAQRTLPEDPPLGRRGRRAGGLPRAVAIAVEQLEDYFAGERREFDVPLQLAGTPFQQTVWRALATIPYGSTASYAELAALVGRPTAFRAVGQANGANPIPLILPCHRVVASGGRIGGYGGGLEMKRALLALEGAGDWR